MLDRRQTREWVHGLTALILGLILLASGSSLGVSKRIVDLLGGVLSIPEYPAVRLRVLLGEARLWAQDKSALQREIERLKDENAKFRILEAAVANERIRADLDVRMNEARVTLRAPLSWWHEIRVDKGEQDGISVGLPIFQDGYLVGRISSVSLFSSWAELLTSPSLMIPVVIEETRELGVVVGDGNGSVLLNYIPSGRGNMAGMKVSTALVGEQLPPGLPIGRIEEEVEVSGNGYATYRLAPGADLSRFYDVAILRPSGAAERDR